MGTTPGLLIELGMGVDDSDNRKIGIVVEDTHALKNFSGDLLYVKF